VDAISARENLGQGFEKLFELTVALTESDIDQVHRIRHDVYCRDLAWEPVRPDGRESDAYDRHAYHCLLRRRGTGEPVGCTRLIVARPDDPDYPLPFENSCSGALDRSIADPAQMARETLGEVSRLAVQSTFRQRKGEATEAASIADGDFADGGHNRRFPFIPVSLYLGAAAIARHLGIENVFVLTEPRLARHFGRIGFDIQPVGNAIEHHGVRVPSLLSSSKVVASLRPMISPLYAVIERSVEEAFRKHPSAGRAALRVAD
jgi:N-acyl amino acid synthase of PEP-CTERM/exosortase system